MQDNGDIISWLTSDPGKAALAGALGGLVRWLTLRDHWREGAPNLIVGAICAVYLGPIAISVIETWLGHPLGGDSTIAGLAPFVTGISGMTISGMVIDLFNRRRKDLQEGK